MLALKRKQPEPQAVRRKVTLRWSVLLGDLSLLLSLTIARFIVWRKIRRSLQERATRRRRFRLIQGSELGKKAVPTLTLKS